MRRRIVTIWIVLVTMRYQVASDIATSSSSVVLPTTSVCARKPASVAVCVGSIGSVLQREVDRDQDPGGDRLVALARRHEAPALDGFQCRVVETRRSAARAQFHGLRGAAGGDEHAQQHAALLAVAARKRRIDRRRIVEVRRVEAGRGRRQRWRRRRGGGASWIGGSGFTTSGTGVSKAAGRFAVMASSGAAPAGFGGAGFGIARTGSGFGGSGGFSTTGGTM